MITLYMNFLNVAKTEREFIKHARKMADENGYREAVAVTVGQTIDGKTVIEKGLEQGQKVVIN